MENYEERSDQAESEAARLAKEGERVERQIAETKRDVQAKHGDPGMTGDPLGPDPDQEENGPQGAEGEPDESEAR